MGKLTNMRENCIQKNNLFSQMYDVALGAWHETRESEAGISSLKQHLRKEEETDGIKRQRPKEIHEVMTQSPMTKSKQ